MFNLFPNNTIKARLALLQRAFVAALKWGFWLLIALSFLLIVIDITTSYWVRDRIYTDINKLPHYQTAVVLGTAKYYTTGAPNLY